MWGFTEAQTLAYVSEHPESMDRLTERERAIWVARHRGDADKRLTLAGLAVIYGITPGRIHQIHNTADRKIQAVMYRDERRCPHCAGRGWIPDATQP